VHGRPLGIIHRDVSPENIIIGTDGYARLIDFGIARAMGRVTVTQQGVIKGKPSYIAPEQVIGKPLGPHTDIYSASVVMWHALTGRKLFVGDAPAEQVFKILRMQVPPPSRLAENVSQRLDALVLRGLARHASRRWPSALAMAEELERDGAMASHRKVGELVRSLDAEHLEERARLVRAVENAPLPPPSQRLVADAPRHSLPNDVSAAMQAARISDEPSRTSLTSEADTHPSNHPRVDLSRRSLLGVAAIAASVALIVAAAVSSFGGEAPPPQSTAGAEASTMESEPAGPQTSASADSSAPTPSDPATDPSATPSAPRDAQPDATQRAPRRGPQPWRAPRPRPYIPKDI
jgi:serine/threonine-protein kinase